MYDAGSAVFTLSGNVVRAPFEQYAKLIESARATKEHVVELGANAASEGFTKFQGMLDRVTLSVEKFTTGSSAQFDAVGASTSKMAASADRSLMSFRGSIDRAAVSVDRMGMSTADSTRIVSDSMAKQGGSATRMADETKVAADSVERSNARIAASSKAAAAEAAGGGGRKGGGKSVVDQAASDSEGAAKKTTSAWQRGFTTLANVGKWVSLGIVGAGAVSIKMAADFQKQMELVRTQAGYTQRDVNLLSKAVLNMAPAVDTSPTRLAQALFHIASSGIPAAKAMDILRMSAEAAKVGNADLESTTNALVAIMRTAPKDIHSAGEAVGVMNDIVGQGNMRMEELTGALSTGILPAAKAVGLGMRDVGAALDVMTARGVPAQEGATRLRTVLSLIANPTAKAQKALDQLGMSHDQLAKDFRSKGLVGALDDLEQHLKNVYGHPLDQAQMRQAMLDYAQRLKDTGASTGTITKSLLAYHHELESTGSAALKSSQLISDAFGGARMGTTMQILMQNIGDVQKHVDNLGRSGAAQRFQKDWAATQKNFSDQAAGLGASVQRLGIQWGTYLIPKVEDSVKWLIQSGHWLGEHKKLADALAIALGTTLTAAVVAFFARFLGNTAKSIKSIGQFGKAIYDLPGRMAESGAKMREQMAMQGKEIDANTTKLEEQAAAYEDVAGASAGVGEAGLDGGMGVPGGAPLAEAETGAAAGFLGMIEGALMGPESPGSRANPIAVVVMAGEQYLGEQAAAGSGKSLAQAEGAAGTAASAESKSRVILPPGVQPESAATRAANVAAIDSGASPYMQARTNAPVFAGARTDPALAAARAEAAATQAESESASVLSRLKGGASSLAGGAMQAGGRLMQGAMTGGMILLGGQIAGSAVGGKAGSVITSAGNFAAGGAALGSLFGPGGAIAGGIAGALAGGLSKLLESPSFGNRVASSLTPGFGGANRQALQKTVSTALDSYNQLTQRSRSVMGPRGTQVQQTYNIPLEQLTGAAYQKALSEANKAGKAVAQQLENGWNQYKFQDEPTMFVQFKAETKNLPPAAQAAALQSATAFSQQLENSGRLAKGSTADFVQAVETQFPGLVKFMGLTGQNSAQTFIKALDFSKAEQNTKNTMAQIGNHFSGVRQAMVDTQGTIYDKADAMIATLQNIVKTGSGPMKTQAIADLKALHDSFITQFTEMGAVASSKMKDISKSVKDGSNSAVTQANKYWSQYVSVIKQAETAGVITVKEGNKLIQNELSDALKQLGVDSATAKKLASQGWTVKQVGSAISSAAQAGVGSMKSSTGQTISLYYSGGYAPGAEYGSADVMTLVDPQGNPRAKMAGDEAIFTRHQMPYVNAGLQMLGFQSGAEGLWNKVTTPNYAAAPGSNFSRGGPMNVIYRATGGYVDPLPGFTLGRTDMGVDANAAPGTPILAIGDSKLVGVQQGWYAGQPLLNFQLQSGPDAGRYWYVAEQISPVTERIGSTFKAGQMVARYASSGTGIEIGWAANAAGETLAQASGATGDASHGNAPAGVAFHSFLTGLAHGKLVAGGPGTMAALVAPKVKGKGWVALESQGVLNQITKAANTYLEQQGAVGGNLSTQGLSGDLVTIAHQIAARKGWNAAEVHDWLNIIQAESGGNMNATNPSSGAFGIAQMLAPGGSPGNLGPNKAKYHQYGGDANTLAGQLVAMGNYISQTYVTPSRAWSHETNQHWYARGGTLSKALGLISYHATGRPPIPALPSGTGFLAGSRPPRQRRGASGVRVVGGGKSKAGRAGGSGISAGAKVNTKQIAPGKQTLSQKTADLLDTLGLGTFAQDQNTLGKLEQTYTDQSNLFDLYDNASGMLPVGDLDTLMNIREQEWAILYGENQQLPGVISALQTLVDQTQGVAPPKPQYKWVGKGKKRHRVKIHPAKVHGGPTTGSTAVVTTPIGNVDVSKGIDGLVAEIEKDQKEVTAVEREVTNATRASARARHQATGHAMAVADALAQQLATYTTNQEAIARQRTLLSKRRTQLSNQLSVLSGTKSSTVDINSLVDTILAGGTSAPANPTAASKKTLHNQIATLRTQDVGLRSAAQQITQAMSALRRHEKAMANQYRAQGFDSAWSQTVRKWKLQDKVTSLKAQIKALQAALTIEKSALTAQQAALQQVKDWQSGGTSGTGAISETLSQTAYDILSLYQQGAELPTPTSYHPPAQGDKPTLKSVEDFLTSLGFKLPAGLSAVGGTTSAQAAAEFADFTAFQQSRAQLFAQFGSNFVPYGASATPNSAGLGAGMQYFAAASGAGAGAGAPGAAYGYARGGRLHFAEGGMLSQASGPGGTTVEITQNFQYGPPDPHTHAQGLAYEMQAAV